MVSSSEITWPAPRLRPFGVCEEDLAVDFNQPRPLLVTRLLSLCAAGDKPLPEDFFWQLSVGKRIQALLLLALHGREQVLELEFKCQAEGCGEGLEFEITLDEIAELQSRAESVQVVQVALSHRVGAFRRPTGQDQLAWLQADFAPDATRNMARALWLGEPEEFSWEGDWPSLVSDALDDCDPLVNFTMSAVCPACGAENNAAADLAEIALRKLRAAQNGLLAMAHRLASRYHWSESEIFAVPHWRRQLYLNLIERDEDR